MICRQLFVFTALFLGIATVGNAETQLNMGGSTNTSGFFPYYSAVATSINKANPDLNVTVISTGGLEKNSVLLQRGQLSFGAMSPDLISDAQEKGYEDFRVLWWTIPAIQNLMATTKSGITNIAEFDGKCFHPGMNGSSGQKSMLKILSALDIQPDLYMSDSGDAINAIKAGRCDGQMKATMVHGLDSASAELNLTTPLHPVGYSSEQIEKIKAGLPWMGFTDMPANVTDGSEPYTVHSIWIGFVTTTAMNEQTGYEIVKGMMEGIEDSRAAMSYLKDVDILQQTLEVATSPLHPGAVRYLREAGYDVPDALVPPEMK